MEPSENLAVFVQLYCKYFAIAQTLLQFMRTTDDLVNSCMAPGPELGLQQQREQVLNDIENFDAALRKSVDSTQGLLKRLAEVPSRAMPPPVAKRPRAE